MFVIWPSLPDVRVLNDSHTRLRMLSALKSLLRELRFQTPLRRLSPAFHRYDYQFTPAQLALLVEAVTATQHSADPIVEIGSATGRTTVFLNRHLDDLGSVRQYHCIDTFSGFTPEDRHHEVSQRGKPASQLDGFNVNRRSWFERNLRENGISRVTTHEADVKEFDLRSVTPRISLCLIDVDLYLPVKAALEKVAPLMCAGGIVVVDDVAPNSLWDGAHQAFSEFVTEKHLPSEVCLGKLGIIRCG